MTLRKNTCEPTRTRESRTRLFEFVSTNQKGQRVLDSLTALGPLGPACLGPLAPSQELTMDVTSANTAPGGGNVQRFSWETYAPRTARDLQNSVELVGDCAPVQETRIGTFRANPKREFTGRLSPRNTLVLSPAPWPFFEGRKIRWDLERAGEGRWGRASSTASLAL